MAKKQSGLGKGLGALMLENNTDSMVSTDTLAVNDIIPNKEQPRKTFDVSTIQFQLISNAAMTKTVKHNRWEIIVLDQFF